MQKVGALRQTRHTVLWFVSLLTVGGLALGLAPQRAFGSVLYTLDFSHQPDGPATNWLKAQGFVLRLNAEELHPYFRDGRLILHTERQTAGLFEHQLTLPSVRRIRIHWGVENCSAKAFARSKSLTTVSPTCTPHGSQKYRPPCL